MIMTIEKKIEGNTAELKLNGWLDTQTSPQLEQEISALGSEITALILDFSELEYISSAGMRQLVSAYKKMNGALTLRNVSAEVMSVISMTGIDKKITIEK